MNNEKRSRIARPTTYGGPDVLEVVDVPVPTPAAGEVVVEVRAAGVNPIDWKLYSGAFHDVDDDHTDAAGIGPAALPTLGLECAGVVVSVGADVTDVEPGAEVIVYPVTAAYADAVTVPPSSLIPKPAGLDWPEAGALMLAGTTAVHALEAAGVGAGDTVLVHAGSGGVGLAAVQLAAARGASVVATASVAGHALLAALGATPVTYGPGLLDRVRAAAPQGVTAALDLAGTPEALDTSLALIEDPARIVSITGSERRAQSGVTCLGYGPGEDAGTEVRSHARAGLAQAAGDGTLRVVVAATYPLADVAQAHRDGQRSHAPGKLVLVP